MARIKPIGKHRLPPHSNEAHPIAQAGEISKPFLIAIIAVVLIIVAALFLFFSQDLVGKAFETGKLNTAGIPTLSTQKQSFSIPVKANIGTAETIGVKFALELPKDVTCSNYDKTESKTGWTAASGFIENTASCANSRISFEQLVLDGAKTGEFDVANVKERTDRNT